MMHAACTDLEILSLPTYRQASDLPCTATTVQVDVSGREARSA